ncbi:AN1-type zinc finger protein 4-like isoform X2 [Bacillus rossius redtenbacheri]
MSIKLKIQRVEGIPVSQQHLLFGMRELDDRACLVDCAIHHGATLKLVLSVRGGPVGTRRPPSLDDLAWRELQDLVENSRGETGEPLPAGCHVTILVFREGDQVNLFRVVENEDGTYSPLSESGSGTTIRNLFAEEDSEEVDQRLHENSVTMAKMKDLKSRLETMSLHRKPRRSAPRIVSAKRTQHNQTVTPRLTQSPHKPDARNEPRLRAHKNHLSLPPIGSNLSQQPSYLETSSLLSVQNSRRSSDNSSASSTSLRSDGTCPDMPLSLCCGPGTMDSTLPSLVSTPQRLGGRRGNGNVTSLRVLPQRRSSIDFECSRKVPMGDTTKNACRTGDAALSEGSSINILSSSDIAILEEDGDGSLRKGFPASHSPISMTSSDEATVAISQYPQERVSTAAVKNSPSRYRLSHVILDEDDRPKTSPEDLSHRQKTAQELCNILSESKWHKRNPRRRDRNTSSIPQLDVLGNLQRQKPANSRLEPSNKCTASSLAALGHLSLGKATASSPKYGRRSVQKPALTPAGSVGAEGSSAPCWQQGVEVRRRAAPPGKHLRPRCAECRKRLNITNVYSCRCEKLFCSTHRYSELHGCTFDYKSEGRRLLEQANPLVAAPKLPKI